MAEDDGVWKGKSYVVLTCSLRTLRTPVVLVAFLPPIVTPRSACDSLMALRGTAAVRAAAARPPSGVIGFLASLKERLASGKLLRPDVADDVLRLPMEQSKYRTPAPG